MSSSIYSNDTSTLQDAINCLEKVTAELRLAPDKTERVFLLDRIRRLGGLHYYSCNWLCSVVRRQMTDQDNNIEKKLVIAEAVLAELEKELQHNLKQEGN